MAKSKSSSSSRAPVKVRGSLRAPVQAPHRNMTPLHKRRSTLIIGAVVLLSLIALVIWAIMQNRSEARAIEREIDKFDRSLSVKFEGPASVTEEISTSPDAFQQGEITAEEFKAQAEGWLTIYRTLHAELREMETPAQVEDARALLVQGTAVALDAIKSFLLATELPEGDGRAKAITQGRSILDHSQAVLFMGRRSLELTKVEFGLTPAEGNQVLEIQAPLPEEDILPPIPGLEEFAPPTGELVEPLDEGGG